MLVVFAQGLALVLWARNGISQVGLQNYFS